MCLKEVKASARAKVALFLLILKNMDHGYRTYKSAFSGITERKEGDSERQMGVGGQRGHREGKKRRKGR